MLIQGRCKDDSNLACEMYFIYLDNVTELQLLLSYNLPATNNIRITTIRITTIRITTNFNLHQCTQYTVY